MSRTALRQLWIAAGASTDAADIVLAKVPIRWAARLSLSRLLPEQVETLHLQEGDARELAF
jgi:hypothetical protein